MTAFLGQYALAMKPACKARKPNKNQGLGDLAIGAPAPPDARNNAKIPQKCAGKREKSGKRVHAPPKRKARAGAIWRGLISNEGQKISAKPSWPNEANTGVKKGKRKRHVCEQI